MLVRTQVVRLFVGSPLLALALSLSSVAQETEPLGCGLQNQPAATLLLPYFEVDPSDVNGRTTLFSIGNTAAEPKLVHITLWTNWGHPVHSFDAFVGAGGTQPFNVRDILRGQIPVMTTPAGFHAAYPSCASILQQPPIDPDALQALLAGAAHPSDGLCYAAPVETGDLLTGYVTVDIVQDCSGAEMVTPLDSGYLGDCATGLASNENVLWGDFFLVDPSNDSAQGERLVSLVADQTRFGEPFLCVDPPCGWRIGETFHAPGGNRMPLPRSYETRFIRGGGFDGGTELLVWIDGSVGPLECGANAASTQPMMLAADARSEAGEPVGEFVVYTEARSFRLPLDTATLPLGGTNFGVLRVAAMTDATNPHSARQMFVMPVMSAAGRYSVMNSTAPVADFCAVE